MSALRIKLCGMFRDEDIDAVREVRPDLVGFIVGFPRSHRSVSAVRATQLARRLEGTGVERVGVFVDEEPELVASCAADAGFEWVQLHGGEDAAYVERLRGLLPPDVRIIQACRIRDGAGLVRAADSAADLVLLDGGQGDGRAFDWQLLKGFPRPFILAGGLGPANVEHAVHEAQAFATGRLWGVDMSSGIETDRVKDPEKMAAALAAVRSI